MDKGHYWYRQGTKDWQVVQVDGHAGEQQPVYVPGVGRMFTVTELRSMGEFGSEVRRERKVIQTTAVAPTSPAAPPCVLALCDDGTLWRSFAPFHAWTPVEGPPK